MSDLFYICLIAIVGGGWLIKRGYTLHTQGQLIANTPTSNVRSLSRGPVEVTGTIYPGPSGRKEAPVSGRECVFYAYEIEERRGSGDSRRWVTIADGQTTDPFYVNDGTGTVQVTPTDGVALDISPVNTAQETTRDATDDESLTAFLNRCDDVDAQRDDLLGTLTNNRRRFSEQILRPNGDAYVFGSASRLDDPLLVNGDEVQMDISEGTRDMFFLSDQSIDTLLDERRGAFLKYLTCGAFLIASGLVGMGLLLIA